MDVGNGRNKNDDHSGLFCLRGFFGFLFGWRLDCGGWEANAWTVREARIGAMDGAGTSFRSVRFESDSF